MSIELPEPGSLQYNSETRSILEIGEDCEYPIAEIVGAVSAETAATDGFLFAAAPDLLAALQAAVDYLVDNQPKGRIRDIFSQLNRYENGVMKPARAAIAKATGGEA